MFLTIAVFILLPKESYAWGEGHGRDQVAARHGHGSYAHSNPDLTLVSGMEGVDSRVLVASGPDQTSEEIDQPATVVVVNNSPQIAMANMDTFIVNVPNNKGGYTPVVIKKWGNGYLGPQGELYYPFPEASQLKAMYGI